MTNPVALKQEVYPEMFFAVLIKITLISTFELTLSYEFFHLKGLI